MDVAENVIDDEELAHKEYKQLKRKYRTLEKKLQGTRLELRKTVSLIKRTKAETRDIVADIQRVEHTCSAGNSTVIPPNPDSH